MPKKNFFVVFLVLLLIITGLYMYLSKTYPQTSPFLTGLYYAQSIMQPHAQLEKHVMGFLPYWRTDDISSIRPQLLSEINYFSITAGPDGELVKVRGVETEPGWNGWQKQEFRDLITRSHIAGTEFSVTIAALQNDSIESILDSQTAQTTLISQIVILVKENNLNGINIDFEYFGEADPVYKQQFTRFSKNLAAKLKREAPGTRLSLSLMPLSARTADIYDFAALAPVYDRFIGMSYDFYGENSEIAGPIAPMRGFKDNKFFFDVETMYEDFANVLPKEKIIMGIPYYGWDWAVYEGKTINSRTLPDDDPKSYAAVISYSRARQEKNLKPKQCTWDEYALETWCWYTKDDVDHQVWLADNKSVETRFDFAKKQNLGGVGIWVLGYDSGFDDLWELITKKFSKKES